MHARPAPRILAAVGRTDAVVAAVLTVAGLAEASLGLTTDPAPVWLLPTGAVVTLAVAVRRTLPAAALGAVLLGLLIQAVAGSDIGGGVTEPVALVLVLYSVGSRLPLRGSLGLAGVGLVGMAAVIALGDGARVGNFVFAGLVVGGAWAAGRAGRLADERGRLLAEHRAALERTRIARELHDVVSHHVSGIVVQAAAERRATGPDAVSAQTLAGIEQSGRQALEELRGLLGVLRADDAPLTPQPGLAQLPDLLASARRAGVEATLEVVGRPHPLGPGPELAVYRVVQEGLTNVAKHAGRTRAKVLLRWSEEQLQVEVTDDGGQVRARRVGGAGVGLAAMAERVAAHGGEVSAGPTPQGFRVHAVLPAGGRG